MANLSRGPTRYLDVALLPVLKWVLRGLSAACATHGGAGRGDQVRCPLLYPASVLITI